MVARECPAHAAAGLAAAGCTGGRAGAKPATAAKAGDDEKKKDAKADDKAKAKGEEEEEDAKDEDKDDETATVVRQPTVWTQRKGMTSTMVRRPGWQCATVVNVAETVGVLCATTEFYIWNVVTTPARSTTQRPIRRRVYRVRPQGKPELVLETEYFGVRGLVARTGRGTCTRERGPVGGS